MISMNNNFAIGGGIAALALLVAILGQGGGGACDWESLETGEVLEEGWGFHIVIFRVGQADAIVLVSPNGDAAVIDAGRYASHGDSIANFLLDGHRVYNFNA